LKALETVFFFLHCVDLFEKLLLRRFDILETGQEIMDEFRRERQRQRERDRETETERETERQRDRERGRRGLEAVP
jgi:hypothetical protein